MDIETTENQTLFRPAKRRKFQRSRPPTEDETLRTELTCPESPAREDIEYSLNEPALTEILRQRKTKARRQGIEFSTLRPSSATESTMFNGLMVTDPQVDRLRAISDRFVGHTGQVVDVDKHMFVLAPGPYRLP